MSDPLLTDTTGIVPRAPVPVQPDSCGLRVRCLETLSSAEQPLLVADWRALTNNPMSDPAWLLTWWQHYGAANPAHRLAVVLLEQADRLIAVAPLYLANGTTLKLLGGGRVCSDHQELLHCDAKDFQRAGEALKQWLLGDASLDWQCIDLESIDDHGPTAEIMQQWDADAVFLRHAACDGVTCRTQLPATWDDYLKEISKNHRKRCRRWWKKYFDSKLLEVRSTTDGWDAGEALACLVKLHNLRRNAISERGAFEDDTFLNFQSEVIPQLISLGKASLTAVFEEGKAVAIEYEFENGETCFAYQSGMDPNTAVDSAGSVSLLHSIHRSIRHGWTHFDFLRGDESYKFHWNADRLPTTRHLLWRRNLRGQLAHSAFSVAAQAKSLKRAIQS